MSQKTWSVVIDGQNYNVTYRSAFSTKKSYVEINGEQVPFSSMQRRTNKYFGTLQEYTFHFGSGEEGILTIAGDSSDVIIHGISVSNGCDYVPADKLPKWSYIFLVLNAAILLFGGAIPVMMAFLGVSWTMQVVVNPRSSTMAKVLKCIGVLVGVIVLMFVLVYAFSALIYSL